MTLRAALAASGSLAEFRAVWRRESVILRLPRPFSWVPCVGFFRSSCFAAALSTGGCKLAENYLDPDGPRYSASYSADTEAPSRLPELKVITFNVQFGEKYEQAGEELATKPELRAADLGALAGDGRAEHGRVSRSGSR